MFKNVLFIASLLLVTVFNANAQSTEKQISKAIKAFVKGGDQQDVALTASVMHSNFRVVINRFRDSKSATIMNKENYLSMLENKKIGGLPRKIEIVDIQIFDHIATVRANLTSEKLMFTSNFSLVLDENDQWMIISDMPYVTAVNN